MPILTFLLTSVLALNWQERPEHVVLVSEPWRKDAAMREDWRLWDEKTLKERGYSVIGRESATMIAVKDDFGGLDELKRNASLMATLVKSSQDGGASNLGDMPQASQNQIRSLLAQTASGSYECSDENRFAVLCDVSFELTSGGKTVTVSLDSNTGPDYWTVIDSLRQAPLGKPKRPEPSNARTGEPGASTSLYIRILGHKPATTVQSALLAQKGLEVVSQMATGAP